MTHGDPPAEPPPTWIVFDSGPADGDPARVLERFEALRQQWRADPHRAGCLVVRCHGMTPLNACPGGARHATGGVAAPDPRWPTRAEGLRQTESDGGRVLLQCVDGPLQVVARQAVGTAHLYLLDAGHLASTPAASLAAWAQQAASPPARLLLHGTAGPGAPDPQALEALSSALQARGWQRVPSAHPTTNAPGAVPPGPVNPVGPPGLRPGVQDWSRRPLAGPAPRDHRWQALTGSPAGPEPGPAPARKQAPGPLHGRRIAVVGAGLAGCAAALWLHRLGASVHLVDRHGTPAAEASGNPAGLVHGVHHPPDAVHARLLQAAAQATWTEVRRLGARVPHGAGLLQAETRLDRAGIEAALAVAGVPGSSVAALDPLQAAALVGLPAQALGAADRSGVWWHRDAGWVDPAALCRAWIDETNPAWHGERTVVRLQPANDGTSGWRLLATTPTGLADPALADLGFDAVVLAAAGEASMRLVSEHADLDALGPDAALQPVRGQLHRLPPDTPGLQAPRLAVSGKGYALTLGDGSVLVGATQQPGSQALEVRASDEAKLREIGRRLGIHPEFPNREGARPAPAPCPEPRVGIRWRTPDRLPLIGSPARRPEPASGGAGGPARLRDLPRVPGLYLFTALGARGIAWSVWGARLLAAQLSGLPAPVASPLLDRMDPARWSSSARPPRG